jgi:UDP-2,3-diacylglucosamine hydrolase
MSEQLLISDLHLSASRPGTLALFLRFLRERAPRADALFILGDLFDAWVGDDDDSELASAVRAGLKALTDSGTRVYIQHGNRDFLIGQDFLSATGAELLDETAVVTLGGKTTLLMHGDLLCTDDVDYQKARLMLRSAAFIADFLARPLGERVALAASYRQKSGEATSLKAEDIMDVSPLTVADYVRHHGVDRLIHGHTHRPGEHQHEVEGRRVERWVLGEWHDDMGEALCVRDGALVRETLRG